MVTVSSTVARVTSSANRDIHKSDISNRFHNPSLVSHSTVLLSNMSPASPQNSPRSPLPTVQDDIVDLGITTSSQCSNPPSSKQASMESSTAWTDLVLSPTYPNPEEILEMQRQSNQQFDNVEQESSLLTQLTQLKEENAKLKASNEELKAKVKELQAVGHGKDNRSSFSGKPFKV